MSADNAQLSEDDDHCRLDEVGLTGSPASIPLPMWPMLWADVSRLNLEPPPRHRRRPDRGRAYERYPGLRCVRNGGAR
jgi:hypothetical protein